MGKPSKRRRRATGPLPVPPAQPSGFIAYATNHYPGCVNMSFRIERLCVGEGQLLIDLNFGVHLIELKSYLRKFTAVFGVRAGHLRLDLKGWRSPPERRNFRHPIDLRAEVGIKITTSATKAATLENSSKFGAALSADPSLKGSADRKATKSNQRGETVERTFSEKKLSISESGSETAPAWWFTQETRAPLKGYLPDTVLATIEDQGPPDVSHARFETLSDDLILQSWDRNPPVLISDPKKRALIERRVQKCLVDIVLKHPLSTVELRPDPSIAGQA
jgi:hypothetical protein